MASSPNGWHPEDIKAQLRMRHGPITTLSLSWGMGRNAITHTLRRADYSRRVEALISEALQTPLHVLWPARWAADGKPLSRSNGFDPIAAPPVRNSHNQRAA